MKIVLFVEGYTEEKAVAPFLKRWLDPRLTRPVGLQTVRFDGWPEMVRDCPKRAKDYLNSPKGDVLAVVALLDLYGLGLPYPPGTDTAAQKIRWATAHLEEKVGDARFRQFFAVHETEAWLLSQPSVFPGEIAKSLHAKALSPETVNLDEPPAKLLDRLYKTGTGRGYNKVTQAYNLFPKIDPEAAFAKCPQLQALLTALLEIAASAG